MPFEQLHPAELLRYTASWLVSRPFAAHGRSVQRTDDTQCSKLPFVIPAQSVRTQPSIADAIHAANGMLVNHGRPQQLINILDRLDLHSDNTHHFHATRRSRLSPAGSTIYNTVILVILASRLSSCISGTQPAAISASGQPASLEEDRV